MFNIKREKYRICRIRNYYKYNKQKNQTAKMAFREKNTTNREYKNENQTDERFSGNLSQSTTSLATIDSGVGSISLSESIHSLDSVISAGPSEKCDKVNVTLSHDHTKQSKQADNCQRSPRNTELPGKFRNYNTN